MQESATGNADATDVPAQGPEAFRIVPGFPEAQRARVAELFWDAFSGKLARVMRPEAKALSFIRIALRPDYALSVLDAEERVLGVAGIKTRAGGLISGGYPELARAYGRAGALWRAPLLDLTERPVRDGQLLMDGIFVAEGARGLGIGTALLQAVTGEALRRGCHEVRLDVIDRNLRARALYERAGFVAVGQETMGIARHLFGFASSTTMVLQTGAGGARQRR